MTKKEKFIKIVKAEIFDRPDIYMENYPDDFADAENFFIGLMMCADTQSKFTDNGKLILQYMKDNEDSYNNFFKAKDIGEGLSISSRTVSGAMRKLINDGFVEKMGADPTIYAITSLGEKVDLT